MLRFATLCTACLLLSTVSVYAQLSGTYTIGGASPDYATFAAAATDLNTSGVSGPVVFNVRTGTYTEQLTLGAITGTSSTNTITFQSESGTASDVTLQYAPTGSSDNWTVQLTDTDHVIFQNMTLASSGSNTSNRRVIDLDGTLEGLSFLNNTIEGFATASASASFALLHSDNDVVTDLTITGNTFTNGGYGIFVRGQFSTHSTGTVISNNVFGGTTSRNIEATYYDGITITSNTLSASSRGISLSTLVNTTIRQNTFTSSSTSATGLFMNSVSGAYRIERNRFSQPSGTAMSVSNSSGSSGSEALIANNLVSLGTGFSGTALNLSGSTNHINVYHNTFVGAVNSTSSYLLRAESSGSSVNLRNNIAAHYGTGVPLSIGSTLPAVSDFNILFSASSVLARVNSTNYSFLSDYQAAASRDLQSQSLDPQFVDRDGTDNTAGTSDDDLTSQSAFVDTEGTDLTSTVTVDFDGTARSAPVSIGAYEFTSGASAPLSGTYTIGGGGDYATLTAAISDLTSRGVSGAVTFNIATGTYTEQVSLSAIAGASGTNAITFQASSGTASDVTVQFEPSSSDNYVVQLSSTHFVTFRNLTFNSDPNADGGSSARIFALTGALENLTLNTVALTGTTFGSNAASLIYASDAVTKNLNITSATFTSGYTAVDLQATFNTHATGAQVTNSTFTTQQRTGIDLNYYDGVTLTGNTLTTPSTAGIEVTNSATAVTVSQNTITMNTTSGTGISLGTTNGASRVEKNRLTLGGGTGINLSSVDGSSGNESLIANNFVSMDAGNGSERGLVLINSDYAQIYHNSVNVQGTFASGSKAIDVSLGSNLDIRNNIFAAAAGFAAYYTSGTAVAASDYNNLFNTGANVARWNSTDYATLAAFQAASSRDANSKNVDPGFTSATDLHASSAFLDNEGTPLAAVTDDIDNEARSGSAPSIGADEYTAASTTLSGTYTIGSGGDYATWAAALSALETNGVSGAVTFNVVTGTYTEQVTLGPVAGASSINTITFQPTSGILGDVTLQADATSGTNYVFLVNGADYVRFTRIAFNADASSDGGTGGRALVLSGGVTGAQVNTCSFAGTTSGGTTNVYALLYAGSSTVTTDLVISSSTFGASEAGIYLDGSTSTGTQITGNTITGAADNGIFVDDHTAVMVSSNTLSGTAVRGISVSNSNGAIRLLKNSITSASGFGMYLSSSDGTSGSEGLLANNAVHMSSGGSTALQLINSDHQHAFHNTLRLGSSVTSGQPLLLSGTQNALTIKNNLLINEAGGYAFQESGTTTNFDSDWNNFYTTGANVVRVSSTDYATLSAYQNAVTTDDNSVSRAVTFVSATDLHLSGASQTDANLSAIAQSSVTDDRDGNARFSLFTAMGADEATTLASSQTISGNGLQDFGASYAVDVNFQGVSGSGPVAGVFFNDPPENVSGITESNTSQYRWVLESGGTLAFGNTTEIRFDIDEIPNAGITDGNDVVVYKRDTPGTGAFTALTTTYASGSNEIVATGFTSFSEFVFGSNTNALPVELTTFQAQLHEGAVLLRWATASETNNAGFEVQWAPPASDTEATWQVAHFAEGSGTTTEAQSYTHRLTNLDPGTYRFRLKQIDFDGTFAYSPEVELAVEMPGTYWMSAAYPNPFNPQAQFELMVQRSQHITASVYDLTGRQIQHLHTGVFEANRRYQMRIDGQGLASGTYLVRILGEDFATTQRIILLK